MILKSGDYKNGYIFTPSSTDEDMQNIYKDYKERNIKVKCIICNKKTSRNFIYEPNGITDCMGLTINNKLADGVFFINGTY